MVASLVGAMSVAQASIVGFTPTGTVSSDTGSGNSTVFFTPTADIYVTALGYFDNGFAVSHAVGLFAVAGESLLASSTITGSSTLDSSFRYNSITSVLLTGGQQYAISSIDVAGQGQLVVGSMQPAAGITFDGYKYNGSMTLSLGTTAYSPPYLGPNMQFAPVPEPTTMIAGALLLLPFGASTLRMLRRRTA